MNNKKNYKKKWKRQSSRLDEFAKNVCKTILASCWQASFTIMRRTFERGTKARLSFSSGPHAPANMANSMEMPVVGLFLDPETMEIQKNFKDLRKFSVRNIAQSSAANVPFPACFSTDISSILSAMLACGAPEKLSLALMPRSYVLRMIVKLAYCLESRTQSLLTSHSACSTKNEDNTIIPLFTDF